MKIRVMQYLEKENIICSKQFGFRAGYSTSNAIVEMVDKVVHSLDNKLYTVAVFLDLRKAFDTVNRDIFVNKMERLGFRGSIFNWFKDYLTNRTIFTDVGCHSDIRALNIGLPQGTVSSPYCFSIYINDMHRCSDKLNFIHFADDTTVYMSGSNLEQLCTEINIELQKLSMWLRAKRLSLNTNKTNYMLFTHANVSNRPISINMEGVQINRTDTVKFLGVHLDDKLNYNNHVLSLSRKLSSISGMMRRISNFVPLCVLKKIYYSFFQSTLSYGIIVWGGCGTTNRNKIISVQNRALRLLSNLPQNVLHPLSFDDLYSLFILVEFYKYALDNKLSRHFHDYIASLKPDHRHNTRFATDDNFLFPRLLKTTSQKQFMYNAVKRYNKLPQHIRVAQNHIEFKKRLRDWMKSDKP